MSTRAARLPAAFIAALAVGVGVGVALAPAPAPSYERTDICHEVTFQPGFEVEAEEDGLLDGQTYGAWYAPGDILVGFSWSDDDSQIYPSTLCM